MKRALADLYAKHWIVSRSVRRSFKRQRKTSGTAALFGSFLPDPLMTGHSQGRAARLSALPMEHMKTPFKPKSAAARPHSKSKASGAARRAVSLPNTRQGRPSRSDAMDPRKAQRNYETYLSLARAEELKGDPVAAENYLQHAEHYFRSMHAGSN